MSNQEVDQDEEQIDEWREQKKESQKKRARNHQQSLGILKKNGIYFEVLNESGAHYRVGEFDFWPTTGKFINRKTKKDGRGVFNLIKEIGGKDTRFCEEHDELSCFDDVIECNSCAFKLMDN